MYLTKSLKSPDISNGSINHIEKISLEYNNSPTVKLLYSVDEKSYHDGNICIYINLHNLSRLESWLILFDFKILLETGEGDLTM